MSINVATLTAQLRADISDFQSNLRAANTQLAEMSHSHAEASRAGKEHAEGLGHTRTALGELKEEATATNLAIYGLGGSLRQAREVSDVFRESILGAAGPLEALSAASLLAAAAVAIIAGETTKLAVEWQEAMVRMENSARPPVQEVAKIGEAMRLLSDTSRSGAVEISNAFSSVAGRFQQYTGTAIDAAQASMLMKVADDGAMASGEGLQSVTNALVQTMIAFHEPVSNASEVMDILSNTSTLTGMSIGEISMAADRMSARLGSSAPTLADTATLLDAVSATGTTGYRAIFSVSTAMEQMIKPTAEGKKVLEALHVSLVDSHGAFVGMDSVIEQLHPKFAQMTTAQREFAASALFGAGSEGAFTSIILDGAEAFDHYRDGVTEVGSTEEAAARVQAEFSTQIQETGHTLETAGTNLGTIFLPAMTAAASGARAGAVALRDDVVPTIGTFVSEVGEKLGALGTIAQGAFSSRDGMAASLDALQGTATNWRDAFVDWIDPASKDAGKRLGSFEDTVKKFMDGAGGEFKDRALNVWVPALTDWVGEADKEILKRLGELAGNVGSWATGPGGNAFGAAGGVLAGSLIQGIRDGLQGVVIHLATDIMTGGGESIVTAPQRAVGGIVSAEMNIAGGFAEGIVGDAAARQARQDLAYSNAAYRQQLASQGASVFGFTGQGAPGTTTQVTPTSTTVQGVTYTPGTETPESAATGRRTTPGGPGVPSIGDLMNAGPKGRGGGGKAPEDPFKGLFDELASNKSRYEDEFGSIGGAMASALDKELTDGTTASGAAVGAQINALAIAMQKAGVEDVQPVADSLAGFVLQAMKDKTPESIDAVHGMIAGMVATLETAEFDKQFAKDYDAMMKTITTAQTENAQKIEETTGKAGQSIIKAQQALANTETTEAARHEVEKIVQSYKDGVSALNLLIGQADSAADRAQSRVYSASDMALTRSQQVEDRQRSLADQTADRAKNEQRSATDAATSHAERLAQIAKNTNEQQRADQTRAENESYALTLTHMQTANSRSAADASEQQARQQRDVATQQQREDARVNTQQQREDAAAALAQDRADRAFARAQATSAAEVAYKQSLEESFAIDAASQRARAFGEQVAQIHATADEQQAADERHLAQVKVAAQTEFIKRLEDLALAHPHADDAEKIAEAKATLVDLTDDLNTKQGAYRDSLAEGNRVFNDTLSTANLVTSNWREISERAIPLAQAAADIAFDVALGKTNQILANLRAAGAAQTAGAGQSASSYSSNANPAMTNAITIDTGGVNAAGTGVASQAVPAVQGWGGSPYGQALNAQSALTTNSMMGRETITNAAMQDMTAALQHLAAMLHPVAPQAAPSTAPTTTTGAGSPLMQAPGTQSAGPPQNAADSQPPINIVLHVELDGKPIKDYVLQEVNRDRRNAGAGGQTTRPGT